MLLGTKMTVADADIIQSSATQNTIASKDCLPDQKLKNFNTTTWCGNDPTKHSNHNFSNFTT